MKTTYEELVAKSDMARITAINSNSDWAKNYWMNVSNKLMERALNLPVTVCRKESILREASIRG